MKKGENPFIVPVFIPQQGCRHQCVFCNQAAITGVSRQMLPAWRIKSDIKRFSGYNRSGKAATLAFYGGNFLGLPEKEVLSLLEIADEFIRDKIVDRIRFSTRPDTISNSRLKLIQNYPVKDIEIGVQSMDDRVLEICRRGHLAVDTVEAVKRLKDAGYRSGLQMMIGLPGQTGRSAMETAEKIAGLSPDFTRIYPAVVLKNSLMADWFKKGKYRPLSLKRAVSQTKEIYLFFQKMNIPVIRMGLQPSEELDEKGTVLAGPYHPAFGHLVFSEIVFDAISDFYKKNPPSKRRAEIRVSPGNESRARGLKNVNISGLKAGFGFDEVIVVADTGVGDNELFIDDRRAAIG